MPTPQGTVLGPGRGFGVTFRTMFRRSSPSSTRSRRSPPRRASTAGTSSTAGPTGWRSASAASCAPGPARPTRSTSRAPRQHRRTSGSRPGERYGRVYQINYLRCILCGLCIEACPTRALTMTNEYELADNNRADLIYEKSDLLAPLLPGMEQPPHPMRLGDDEGDYYRGDAAPPRRSRRDAAPRRPARRPTHDRLLDPRADHGARRARASSSSARPCTPRCCWPS